MATLTNRLSLSSISSHTSSKSLNLHDLIQKFYTLVERLKENHETDLGIVTKRIKDLELENKQLQTIRDQHPHSIFDIDYVSNDSSTIHHLQSELDRAHKQIDALQITLNQQHLDYEEMKTKYSLQRLMNENHFEQQNSSSDTSEIKELQTKLQEIKEQINQFDQCNYESEEQIRLLKQIISKNDSEQMKTMTQSLTVKQTDLFQQTEIVENILNKQKDKILEKMIELFERNPPIVSQTTTKNKKSKKKRL